MTDAGKDEDPFQKIFNEFASFGAKGQKEVAIGLKNIDKWISQAGLSKKLTSTYTGIAFSKIAKGEHTLSAAKFQEFMAEVCKNCKMDVEAAMDKLKNAGVPGLTNVTQAAAGASAEATKRLTDVSGYTGSHKERFDESGKGRGLEGRKDIVSDSGYVQGYKEEDTYDKTHPNENQQQKVVSDEDEEDDETPKEK